MKKLCLFLFVFILGNSLFCHSADKELRKNKIDYLPEAILERDNERKVVVILKSGSAQPYTIAAAGIKDVINERCADVRLLEYTLKSEDSGFSRKNLHLCKKIKASNPQLVLTVGTRATEIAIQEIQSIPIIYSMVLNPEESGFTANGVIGVSLNIPAGKVYEMAKQVFPEVKTIGIIHKSSESRAYIENSKNEAGKRGLELVSYPIKSEEEIRIALKSLCKRVDALWMVPTSIYVPWAAKEILLYALREGIPVIGLSPRYVKAGALFSLSCDYEDIGHQAGEAAVEVLRGEKSLDNTPVLPRSVVLSFNLIVAERLGIKMPGKFILKAKNIYGRSR